MAIPDYQTLMRPVLQLAGQKSWRVPEIAEQIAIEFGLTEAERDEFLPSGKQRILHNRIHWAKFYLAKAGLIESPKRGLFRATPAGLALLAKTPAGIDNQVLKSFPAFRIFTPAMRRSKLGQKLTSPPPSQHRKQPLKSRLMGPAR